MKNFVASMIFLLAINELAVAMIVSSSRQMSSPSPRNRKLTVQQSDAPDQGLSSQPAQTASKESPEGRKTFGFPFLPSLDHSTRPLGESSLEVGDQNSNENNGQDTQYGPFGNQNGLSFAPMNPMDPYMMSSFNPMMNPMHPLSPMNPLNRGLEDPQDGNDYDGESDIDYNNELYDDIGDIKVKTDCRSVKKQALEIANTLMQKQNHKIFKELLAYLVKNKFLIGMTEIKLTKHLRKRLYGLMEVFSSLKPHQVNFIDPNANDLLGNDLYNNINEKWLDQQTEEKPEAEFVSPMSKVEYPSIDNEDKNDVEAEESEDLSNDSQSYDKAKRNKRKL
jgi:hypothetical protein